MQRAVDVQPLQHPFREVLLHKSMPSQASHVAMPQPLFADNPVQ
jgi:hypothetical protein